MALSPIDGVRLFIGDTLEPQTFTDDQIQYFLDMAGGSVRNAAIFAIYAMLADLGKNKSIYRETAGNYEAWSNAIEYYKLILANITSNPTLGLGSLMPYAAGIDRNDVLTNQYDGSSYSGNLVRTTQDVDRDAGCWDYRYGWMGRFCNGMPDLPYWCIN